MWKKAKSEVTSTKDFAVSNTVENYHGSNSFNVEKATWQTGGKSCEVSNTMEIIWYQTSNVELLKLSRHPNSNVKLLRSISKLTVHELFCNILYKIILKNIVHIL